MPTTTATDRLDESPGAAGGLGMELYWIPLGAGAHVVRISGRTYEVLSARHHHRPRCDLYHSALVATTPEGRFVIEMTPIPSDDSERGVVGQGPVGARPLGRFRLFRYEIRRWRNGVIPDVAHAVDSPVPITDDPALTRGVLDLVPMVPRPVWGRDELHAGEMWNSNSVIAWLLTRAGLDCSRWRPPLGGRAPGWDAGLVTAARTPVTSSPIARQDLTWKSAVPEEGEP